MLVTGGAGFIGSHLVENLLAAGHDVTLLDNFSTGFEGNISHLISNKKLTVLRGDILDEQLVFRACEHKQVVFHLAAFTRIQPSILDPVGAVQINCVGTTNVLQACKRASVPRVIYAGSSSAYGNRHTGEVLNGTRSLAEDMQADCRSPYALSKKFGEDLMALYTQLHGISTCTLRFFNVYGSRQPETGSQATLLGVFSRALRTGEPFPVVGDGTQRRDFTHVSDVVRALVAAASRPHVTGIVNIGYGQNWSVLEVAALLSPHHPRVHLPARQGESAVTLADTSRARQLLDWRPQVSLEKGIAELRPSPRP